MYSSSCPLISGGKAAVRVLVLLVLALSGLCWVQVGEGSTCLRSIIHSQSAGLSHHSPTPTSLLLAILILSRIVKEGRGALSIESF